MNRKLVVSDGVPLVIHPTWNVMSEYEMAKCKALKDSNNGYYLIRYEFIFGFRRKLKHSYKNAVLIAVIYVRFDFHS